MCNDNLLATSVSFGCQARNQKEMSASIILARKQGWAEIGSKSKIELMKECTKSLQLTLKEIGNHPEADRKIVFSQNNRRDF